MCLRSTALHLLLPNLNERLLLALDVDRVGQRSAILRDLQFLRIRHLSVQLVGRLDRVFAGTFRGSRAPVRYARADVRVIFAIELDVLVFLLSRPSKRQPVVPVWLDDHDRR